MMQHQKVLSVCAVNQTYLSAPRNGSLPLFDDFSSTVDLLGLGVSVYPRLDARSAHQITLIDSQPTPVLKWSVRVLWIAVPGAIRPAGAGEPFYTHALRPYNIRIG